MAEIKNMLTLSLSIKAIKTKMLTTLDYSIEINASLEKVWKSLWELENYKKWTAIFSAGSYYETSEFVKGNSIHLLTPTGDGMYSIIEELKINKILVFHHIGALENFKEMPIDPTWKNAHESYQLIEKGEKTILMVKVDTLDQYIDGMNKTFPLALKSLKDLAEN